MEVVWGPEPDGSLVYLSILGGGKGMQRAGCVQPPEPNTGLAEMVQGLILGLGLFMHLGLFGLWGQNSEHHWNR